MKAAERYVALAMAVCGVATMVYAWRTLKLGAINMPDAGFLPFLAGAALSLLSVVWAIQSWKAQDPPGAGTREWRRPMVSLVLMLLYAWAIEAVGYITSTLAFMAAWQQIVERERWGKTILISVIGTAAMYALFAHFLRVPIPQEVFLR